MVTSHVYVTIKGGEHFITFDPRQACGQLYYCTNFVDKGNGHKVKQLREKNARSRCVISIQSGTTTIIHDPKNPEHIKAFTFDLAYWSHSGFQRDKNGVLISTGSNNEFAGQENCLKVKFYLYFNLQRTKKIKNEAVINVSPNEKLIKELKAENNRLLSKLAGLGNYNTSSSDVGQAPSNKIILQGLGISDKHATFTNMDGEVTVTPQSKCRVIVNGVPTATETKLQHLDRVILGSNSAFLYIGFPSERSSEDLARFDYDFFQSELAAAEGVSVDKLSKHNPHVLFLMFSQSEERVFLQGIVEAKFSSSPYSNNSDNFFQTESSPLEVPKTISEGHSLLISSISIFYGSRQMVTGFGRSQEWTGLKMELKVKNLASSDSKGYDLQKEVTVKVTNRETQEVRIWSKAKFINRKYLMEEFYQHFLDGGDIHVAQEDDPFWDPIEAIHLGSAHVWFQSLAYSTKLEEQAELLNSEGLEEAIVLINIIPCSSIGDYKVYDLSIALYTKPVWKNVNAKIEETVHFVALNASHKFSNYLQKNALIVDFRGLQEGCAELNCTQEDLIAWEGNILVDNTKTLAAQETNQATSNQMAKLYMKLLKLEQETELLKNINRVLREENMLFKGTLRGCSPGQDQKLSSVSKITHQHHSDSPQMCTSQTSYDADFAKALKVFYQSMNTVRRQFLKLRHYRPPEDDQMLCPFTQQQSQLLKDIGELLEASLWKLKNDVALIVKKKRESLVHTKYRGSSFP
ncbi:kinesin-like protein KIF28P [Sarcophilus harrisii]|uniref:kinesin-like protein KIF28P n=1 Tax=Sarcophilus harrisii TaxID=9305 RepID=UPI001301FC77|nr:kinesin-like protein KIF28P [Sarcophilus harrisii]